MKLQTVTLALLAFVVGNSLPSQFTPQSAQAAPADVVGSANVAVDTYRNAKGTYVVWADGRITNAQSGAEVNPRRGVSGSYDDPAGFTNPHLDDHAPGGSPNVAVKTVSRSDATYVLFADGKLKKPHDGNAGLPQMSKAIYIVSTQPTTLGSPPGSIAYNHDEISSVSWEGGASMMVTLAEPLEDAQLYGITNCEKGDTASPQGVALQRVDDQHYRVSAPTLNPENCTRWSMSFFLSAH